MRCDGCPQQNDFSYGSRPCENDFGPPKSPSGSRRIAEERRTEQYFPTAPGGVCRSDDLTGQPHGTWMVPMRAFGRITPTP